MYTVVYYKGIPEVWEPKNKWQLQHLGSNYTVSNITFKTKEAAEEYLEKLNKSPL